MSFDEIRESARMASLKQLSGNYETVAENDRNSSRLHLNDLIFQTKSRDWMNYTK